MVHAAIALQAACLRTAGAHRTGPLRTVKSAALAEESIQDDRRGRANRKVVVGRRPTDGRQNEIGGVEKRFRQPPCGAENQQVGASVTELRTHTGKTDLAAPPAGAGDDRHGRLPVDGADPCGTIFQAAVHANCYEVNYNNEKPEYKKVKVLEWK